MTQEQKLIKIAEACGWKPHPKDRFLVIPPNSPNSVQPWHTIPDYFRCLNAMHEAEKVLSDLNHGLFRRLLFTSYYNSGGDSDRRTNDEAERWRVSATAAQRAEAFGLTLGLWK